MNFSRFSAFSAITGPAERKNSLQMRRFQTISEFSHGLGRKASSLLQQELLLLQNKILVFECICFHTNIEIRE